MGWIEWNIEGVTYYDQRLQWSTTLITLSRYEMYDDMNGRFPQNRIILINLCIINNLYATKLNQIDYSLGCDMFTLQFLRSNDLGTPRCDLTHVGSPFN